MVYLYKIIKHLVEKWVNNKEQSDFYNYKRIIAHFAIKNLSHPNINLIKSLVPLVNNSILNRVQLTRDVPNFKYKL